MGAPKPLASVIAMSAGAGGGASAPQFTFLGPTSPTYGEPGSGLLPANVNPLSGKVSFFGDRHRVPGKPCPLPLAPSRCWALRCLWRLSLPGTSQTTLLSRPWRL